MYLPIIRKGEHKITAKIAERGAREGVGRGSVKLFTPKFL
jgi:hypothetical protein